MFGWPSATGCFSHRLRPDALECLLVPRRRPKLGQHFLTAPRYRRRIIEALPLRPDDLVVEIGPGRGAMTAMLAERARQVVAVELDTGLAAKLQEQLPAHSRIEIIRGDILSTNLDAICRRHRADKCFVFGNLPYYITSPIIHHLFASADWIRGMALLVQREVAERLTASPGCRAYGYLSVLAQLGAQPRIALGVPPGAFSPPPKVHSALVSFEMTSRFPAWRSEDTTQFLEFVKRCFAQKRKNLRNNLAGTYSRGRLEEEFVRLGLSTALRAEQLSLEQLAALWKRLHRQAGATGPTAD